MSEGASGRVEAGDRLKIAFLGDPSSIHLRRWLNYFADRGHDVTLLVPADWAVDPAQMPAVSIERFTRFAARGRFAPASYLRARRSLRSVLARVRPDVLNAHYLTSNGWHAWISGFHPYAVTLWGSDIFLTPKESRDFGRYARLTLRAADMVMVNSAALQRGALALGAAPDRTEMVQWGVDLTRFCPGPDPAALRARLGLEGKRVIFSPRGLASLYRHGVVIEALSRLPSDVVVVMTTQHCVPEELEAVRRKIDELGLVDRVTILPEIGHNEMPDFYRMAEVMVTVPASDSTSVAILESLASGLQIVAGDLPSVREWLHDLDPAALVPIDDSAATAAALARALDRGPKERARIARAGRAIVEERADQAKSLARVESLYQQLAARKRAVRRGG